MSRRRALVVAGAMAAPWPARRARAQDAPLRLALDAPSIDGPSAGLALPALKGYFKQERLALALDATGSAAAAVARVAAGSHELGCADLAALMEYHANAGAAAGKPPVAVMMVHANTPSAVLALRRSGIGDPKDLKSRHLAAPASDAARRTWRLFAKLNGIEGATWSTLEPAQAEALLLRGEVDAITGAAYTALPDLEARGAGDDEVVLLPYSRYGIKHYGQAIIAGDEFMRRRPDALRGFLRAFARGMRDVVADPRAAIAALRQRDAALDAAHELRRLALALEHCVLSADAHSEGFGSVTGPRLALMASQVSDAYATRERVNPNAVWNGSFLPGVAERNLFAVSRHWT
jgi:NitT/TauT family transport system substrate-binding protein